MNSAALVFMDLHSFYWQWATPSTANQNNVLQNDKTSNKGCLSIDRSACFCASTLSIQHCAGPCCLLHNIFIPCLNVPSCCSSCTSSRLSFAALQNNNDRLWKKKPLKFSDTTCHLNVRHDEACLREPLQKRPVEWHPTDITDCCCIPEKLARRWHSPSIVLGNGLRSCKEAQKNTKACAHKFWTTHVTQIWDHGVHVHQFFAKQLERLGPERSVVHVGTCCQ